MNHRALRASNAIHAHDWSLTWRERVLSWRFAVGMLAIGMVLLLCAAVPGFLQ